MKSNRASRSPRSRGFLLAALGLFSLAALIAAGAGQTRAAGHYRLERCEEPRTFGVSNTRGQALMVGNTLESLTGNSDLVFVGRAVEFQSCRGTGRTAIFTKITFDVQETLKGDAPADGRFVLNVDGGDYGDYTLAAGTSPEFAIGERSVVFADHNGFGEPVPSEGYQSKLIVGARGNVISADYNLDQLRIDVARAQIAGIPPSSDPLVNYDEDPFATPSYLLKTWKHADATIPVPVNMNAVDDKPAQLTVAESREAIVNAFHAWQNLSDAYIAFGPIENTSRVSSHGPWDALHDTTWGIAGSHSSSTLAVTYTTYSGNTILDSDVEIDTDHFGSNWRVNGSGSCGTGVYDLQTVLVHEDGHFIGLAHPSSNSCSGGSCPVMDASYGGVQRTPCTDDANGAIANYPTGVGAVPAAPANLAADRSTSTDLTWDNVSSEWGFEIWRGDAPCSPAPTFTLLDSVDNDVLAYTDDDYDNGLDSGTTYCYKVRAFNDNGESSFSESVEAAGSGPTPTPSPTPSTTATPTPAPTPTPTPSPTPTPTPTPAPSSSPTPTPTPTPTPDPSATATPPPSSSPTPTATPTPAPTPTDSGEPTEPPTDTPTPTATPTPTPTPTSTAAPGAIAGDADCNGLIQSVDALGVLRHVGGFFPDATCIDHTDTDCDTDIDAVDGLNILKYIVGAPPSDTPGCPPVGTTTTGSN